VLIRAVLISAVLVSAELVVHRRHLPGQLIEPVSSCYRVSLTFLRAIRTSHRAG
jgi:hypothetical protein